MQSVIEHPVPVMQVMLPRRPVVPHELSWLPWFTQELIRVKVFAAATMPEERAELEVILP